MALLEGITVIDLTHNVSGPFCTMLLADLGANVIKIERPGGGDDARRWGPPFVGGESCVYLSLNRGKRSISLDWTLLEGQEVLRTLCKKADILVENHRVGTLDKHGLSYDQLAESNSRLIYCSISAYGSSGPLSKSPGYDSLMQAYSGLMSVTGLEESTPVRVGTGIIDIGTGLWAAVGLISALYQRELTGKGQKVEVSLFEVGVAWLPWQFTQYLLTGTYPEKLGSAFPMAAPYQAFRTADDYIMIGAPNNSLWVKLCKALMAEHLLADERFINNSARVQNRLEVEKELEAILVTNTTEYWINQISKEGVPCTSIQNISQVVQNPQFMHLNMVTEMDHPTIGKVKTIRPPFQLSGWRPTAEKRPPLVGEHTVEVLREVGISDAEIEELRKIKAVGC